eukprot:511072_1
MSQTNDTPRKIVLILILFYCTQFIFGQQCTTFLRDELETVSSNWTKISGTDVQLMTGTPFCEDNNWCWMTGSDSYYKRPISLSGYTNITLSFNYYQSALDPGDYCRIKYSFNDDGNTHIIFEDSDGTVQRGPQTVTLSPNMYNQSSLTLYIQSQHADSIENCYFDAFAFCGFPITPKPTTNIPSNAPTQYIISSAPTFIPTYNPTENPTKTPSKGPLLSTRYPSKIPTFIPTISPSEIPTGMPIQEREQIDTTTVSNDHTKPQTKMDLIVWIIIVLGVALIFAAICIWCYCKRSNLDNENKRKMKKVKGEVIIGKLVGKNNHRNDDDVVELINTISDPTLNIIHDDNIVTNDDNNNVN